MYGLLFQIILGSGGAAVSEKMAHLALCLQPPAKCDALSDLPHFERDINIPFPPGRGIL